MDSSTWSTLQSMLPFLIPVIVVELVLLAAALIDWFKQPVLRGPKWVWLLVILFVNLIGPIIYFVAARKDE